MVIALTTLFSYLHILRSIRAETLAHLKQHVLERSEREQALFLLGEDNHAFLKKALEARIQAWRKEDPDTRFDSLFARLPDGTIRSRPEGFDGTRMLQGVSRGPPGRPPTPALARNRAPIPPIRCWAGSEPIIFTVSEN